MDMIYECLLCVILGFLLGNLYTEWSICEELKIKYGGEESLYSLIDKIKTLIKKKE